LTAAASFLFVGVASGTETITLDNGASDSDGILRIRHSIVGRTFANVEFANKAELVLDTDQGAAAVQNAPGTIVLTVNGGDRDILTLRNSEIVGVPARVRVLTHQGADVVKIEGQNAPIELNTGTGNDTIIVGEPGPLSGDGLQDGGVATKTLNAFMRDIVINDTPDPLSFSSSTAPESDILTLDDGGDTIENVGELTASSIRGVGLGTRVSYSGMETVNIQLGSGKDTLNVRSTLAGVSYNVNAGAGSDLLRLGSRGSGSAAGGGTVNGIRGAISFNGGAGVNSIVLDDSGDTASNTGNLIPGRLRGMGMADVLFSSVSRVNVFCGSGDDTFINQILPGGAISVAVDLGAGE
jgi:acrosin